MNNERKSKLFKATLISIVSNIALAVVKIAIGLISRSIAFVTDGVNNATDSLSSFITLIGYKLSKKRPTKEHPLGYGRAEYISAMMVSFIIIFAGISFFQASFDKILHPDDPSVSTLMLIIISLTVFVKIFLCIMNKRVGRAIKSAALVASGTDALSDVAIALITILSAIVHKLFNINADGYAGIIVALFITINGLLSLKDIINTMLGERPERATIDRITAIINEHPPLHGCYDVMLHSYGPEEAIGACTTEVPSDRSLEEIFDVIRDVTDDIYNELNISMTIGMLAVNNNLPDVRAMENKVLFVLRNTSEYVLSIHAFHIHTNRRLIHFDMVVDFKSPDINLLRKKVTLALEKAFPGYSFEFSIDPDYA